MFISQKILRNSLLKAEGGLINFDIHNSHPKIYSNEYPNISESILIFKFKYSKYHDNNIKYDKKKI